MFSKKIKFFNKSLLINSVHSWITPKGYDTNIKIYNCITKKNEPLIVRNKNAVTFYTCGPTVYGASHVGHASCYIKLDNIQRILKEHFRINLITCLNITDIDDKIIKKAKEAKTTIQEVSSKYEKEFWRDLAALRVTKPDLVLRVTENIPLIVNFIENLISKEAAYVGDDNSVYFDTIKSFHPPGRLQNLSDTPSETRNKFKRSATDFALWKAIKNEDEPFFNSPWGKGRPGWHIECSTLGSDIFGSNIDIHAGGLDLRFPHHENEELQSCAFHSTRQWVNYWIHTGHLQLKDSIKMSKSLNNTVSIEEMLKIINADVFRLACAKSHYSSSMEYSEELLKTSAETLQVYKNLVVNISEVKKGFLKPTFNNDILTKLLIESATEINESFCDNFNTPRVFKILDNLTSTLNSMIHSTSASNNNISYQFLAINNFLLKIFNLFGINFEEHEDKENKNEDVNQLIDSLVEFRQNIRNIGIEQKNKEILNQCDKFRANLRDNGLFVKDHGKISSWSR